MKFILLFLGAMLPIFASNLLTYNIYERTDRVDIMLSFDAPYEGNIFQKREKNTTSLILNSLSYEQSVNKNINSKIVQELDIEPKQNSLILNLKSQDAIIVNASKTTDGFGLRIRVSPKNTASQVANMPQASAKIEPPTQALQSEPEPIVDARYFIVLGVLLALLIFLFIFKKIMVSKSEFSGFANTKNSEPNSTKSINWLLKNQNNDVNVIYEKPLDRVNKLMLLSYENRRYLVLVGSSNVMLDSFGEEKIQNEQDFTAFFEENKKKLGAFLQERQNSLNNYKDKMSMN
ncbi:MULTISPECIES: excinuclease ABC subunit A [Campylobacter]|uniref:excinuclease ABC subunit A n=1 Tax=Campylobacter TaxID=194 RepID=UPI0019D0E0A4|nr:MULTISPECIES: excinuclease ABC subunit A [Campylobacter]MBN7288216.1 excinuclease ABC subunit A [Campylobacter curvus]MDU6827089.1 excinuclease ABC subunit A [Campylobacter sp.]